MDAKTILIKKYKINTLKVNTDNRITIPLPDVKRQGDKVDISENILRLISDLKSGIFNCDRFISYDIANRYPEGNEITIISANTKISSPVKLFHWTDNENLAEIMKFGLLPKSRTTNPSLGRNGVLSYKAIFLVKQYGSIHKIPGHEKCTKKYRKLLEINSTNLVLYVDPSFFMYKSIDSYVTFNPIPKELIKIVL